MKHAAGRSGDPERCPCGAGAYATCCRPLHEGEPAADALALMRARYSAYARRDAAFLLASWHADTRPPALDLAEAPSWLGLDIRRHEIRDADHAVVEFVVRYRIGGGRAQRQHETSRFVREAGCWYYLDGELAD